jgi:hypothetical protein
MPTDINRVLIFEQLEYLVEKKNKKRRIIDEE